ncbi:hypothetical protein H6P81_018922 [Aristolochia fimbriata]|uniref:Large ribosomal subunit protein bL20c n=1 Tax=Aristolochia fimbriata TaxID=158543 RepID=A0AAV7E3B2_ARIFI|nr:hypothetical protein H6P81_018922 [Aristolochia fimbriata]
MNKKKIFKLAKGFRGRAKNCIRIARERVEKALQYSYRDRRNKKRDMRSLWIERINAGTRVHGVNYGNFMHGLMKENIQLNRKVLSELSMHEPYSFKALVDISRKAFPGNKPIAPKKEGLASILSGIYWDQDAIRMNYQCNMRAILFIMQTKLTWSILFLSE